MALPWSWAGLGRRGSSCRHVLGFIREQKLRQGEPGIGSSEPTRQTGRRLTNARRNLVEVFPIRLRRRVQAVEQIGAFGFVEGFQCAHAAIW